jgi:hypothetical protein
MQIIHKFQANNIPIIISYNRPIKLKSVSVKSQQIISQKNKTPNIEIFSAMHA